MQTVDLIKLPQPYRNGEFVVMNKGELKSSRMVSNSYDLATWFL